MRSGPGRLPSAARVYPSALALVFACVGLSPTPVHAQSAPPPQTLASPAPTVEASADLDATPSPQLSAADVTGGRESELQAELLGVRARRAGTPRLWPWLLIGTGVGAVVTGLAVAAGGTLGCDSGCSTPAWTELAVVAGVGVAAIGAVWLSRVNHSLHQIELHQHQLEFELERLRFGRARLDVLPPAAASWAAVRLRF
ncbi:MAG TPA: hypothetical protein VF331_15955 [Polyangiales bacterium]